MPQTIPTLTTRMTGSPTRTHSTPPMMRPPYPTLPPRPPPRPSSMTPRLTPRPLPAYPRPCSGTSQGKGATQEGAPHLSSPTGRGSANDLTLPQPFAVFVIICFVHLQIKCIIFQREAQSLECEGHQASVLKIVKNTEEQCRTMKIGKEGGEKMT